MKTRFNARREPWNGGIGIAIAKQKNDGSLSHALNIVMGESSHAEIIEPVLRLSQDEAQELFNELWQAGMRPLDGTGNSGHILSIERHLNDMRALVFKGKKP